MHKHKLMPICFGVIFPIKCRKGGTQLPFMPPKNQYPGHVITDQFPKLFKLPTHLVL